MKAMVNDHAAVVHGHSQCDSAQSEPRFAFPYQQRKGPTFQFRRRTRKKLLFFLEVFRQRLWLVRGKHSHAMAIIQL